MRLGLALLACAAVTAAATGHPGPPPVRAPAPPYVDARPILIVHGFEGHSRFDCAQLATLKRALGPTTVTVGLYAADTGCDTPGFDRDTVQTSLETLAHHVADLALTMPGPVDLVGHSMGGLLVDLTASYLPAGKVAHVVALASPFGGAPTAVGCPVTQCREMAPGSTFHAGLSAHVDLCVASTDDEIVPPSDALDPHCATRRTVRGLHHGDLLVRPVVISAIQRELQRDPLSR